MEAIADMEQSIQEELLADDKCLLPAEIVAELDRYIISQGDAKRTVAIALRNRWRRLRVPEEMREEIIPKNIIMIGPTGVGKTEIARRLAKLAKAPFVKVEATKFTEVGYVGRDVDSIVRDLVEISFNLVREEEEKRVLKDAEVQAEERLLDLLMHNSGAGDAPDGFDLPSGPEGQVVMFQMDMPDEHDADLSEGLSSLPEKRESLRQLLRESKLSRRMVDVEVTRPVSAQMQVLGPQGFAEMEGQIKDMFQNMIPRQRELRHVSVDEARKILIQEAQENLVDPERVARKAVRRVEQSGIVFIDEIDKICGSLAGKGPDVSREGVQRDLLPLVEGSTVSTRHGTVKSDHVLFIASGAFHTNKPSDLMPEFQGRFPVRVELKSLSPDDFVRILTEPKNALVKQYQELMRAEGVELEFSEDAIREIARLTADVNAATENIGARRLYTLMEKLLEDLSFEAHTRAGTRVLIDRSNVLEKLSGIAEDRDLSRFIL